MPSEGRDQRDEEGSAPGQEAGLTDDETPLGDTAEGHEAITPHDFPPDHPGRHAAEELAKGGGEDGQEAVRTPRN